ncbi:cid.2 family protein [Megaselia abdita]
MDHQNWLGDGSEISDDSDNNNTTFRSPSTDAEQSNYNLEFTGNKSRKTSTKYSRAIIEDANSVVETPKISRRKSEANLRKSVNSNAKADPAKNSSVVKRSSLNNSSKARASTSADKSVSEDEAEEADESSSSESSRTSGGETLPPSPKKSVPKEATKSGKLQSFKKSLISEKDEQKKSRRKQAAPGKLKPKSKAVFKEIMRLQSSVNNLIPKLSFSRLVKEVMQEVCGHKHYRVTAEFLIALQESSELYLTHFFSDAYLCTIHRGRMTLIPKDMQLALRLRGINDPGSTT